jgi:hypothetical protein
MGRAPQARRGAGVKAKENSAFLKKSAQKTFAGDVEPPVSL